MASFTDAISQFNPYVQQLPLEAMLQVGTYKQQKYEQGVQKIQGQIDRVAGLDIVRDVDKQYLQSKLNELGSKLKTVAGGDFSNFQLVNSVGGMASQIGKDDNVQNAVSSTYNYKKQLAEIETAKKQGKAGTENIWLFNDVLAKEWLTSEKVGEKFNGSYTPYVDVKKKIMTDVISKINPNLREEDIPWATDANGMPKVGEIAAAMSRISKENVSESQIRNAINATLTPTELNQLSISGRYQFKDRTPEELAKYSRDKFKANDDEIISSLKYLEGYANLNRSDTDEYNKTLDAIKKLKLKQSNLPIQLEKELKYVSENPEGAKSEIYKDGFLNSFAEAFSWEKNKKQILENPYLNADHWEKDYAIRKSANKLAWDSHTWDKQQDLIDNEFKRQDLDFKRQSVFGTLGGATSYLGESTLVKDPYVAVSNDLTAKNLEYSNFIGTLAKQLKTTPAGAIEQLNNYRDGKQNSIPVDYRGLADAAIDNKVAADNLSQLLNNTEAEINLDPKIRVQKAQIEASVATLPGLVITTLDGSKESFTNKEIFNYLNKKPQALNPNVIDVSGKSGIQDLSLLSKKEKKLYDMEVARVGPNSEIKNAQRKLMDIDIRYSPVIAANRKANGDVYKARNENLLTKTGKFIPALTAITVSNKEGALSRDRLEGLAMNALTRFTGIGGEGTKGGAAELSNSDAQDGKDWLNSKEKDNILFSKLTQGDKVFLVMALGNKEKVIPLVGSEIASLPVDPNELSVAERDARETQSYFNGNTNGSNDPLRAYYKRKAFPNVKTLSVTADLNRDKTPGKEGLNYLNINLRLPSGWKNLQLDDSPMNVRIAAAQLAQFTDEDIKNLFLKSKKVEQAWKDEILTLQ